MPDKSEASRQKELKQAVREDARRKLRQTLPVPVAVMKGLFDHVDAQLAQQKCDHSLRHTREFIHSHGLPEDAVVHWLEDNHGYCDCEVIFNSEEILEDAVPGYHDIEPSGNAS
jgi:Protein of unknown function (DUF2695)